MLAPNLERHPLHKGGYIAYDAQGYAFRVDRALAGGWRARPSHAGAAGDYRLIYGRTLGELASKVAASHPAAA